MLIKAFLVLAFMSAASIASDSPEYSAISEPAEYKSTTNEHVQYWHIIKDDVGNPSNVSGPTNIMRQYRMLVRLHNRISQHKITDSYAVSHIISRVLRGMQEIIANNTIRGEPIHCALLKNYRFNGEKLLYVIEFSFDESQANWKLLQDVCLALGSPEEAVSCCGLAVQAIAHWYYALAVYFKVPLSGVKYCPDDNSIIFTESL